MRFFIETVTTYSTSGKTRKGYAIQQAVKPFEHILLMDDQAFKELYYNIERLVAVCNARFRGAELFVSHNRQKDCGQISVHPKATGSESPVVTVSYAILLEEYSGASVRLLMADMVRTYSPDIYDSFKIRKESEKEE